MSWELWRKRSRENLQAAERLHHEGRSGFSLWNAATSRLYYALFQAVVGTLTKRGKAPTDFIGDANTWRHGLVETACGSLQERDLKHVYGVARGLRERADYMPESPVDQYQFEEMMQDVRRHLTRLGVHS